MSIDMKFHAFAGSNIRSKIPRSKERTPASALDKHSPLQSIYNDDSDNNKILLFRNGRSLLVCPSVWRLEWLNTVDCRWLLGGDYGERPIVYLGVDGERAMRWGVDVSSNNDGGGRLGKELERRILCFVEHKSLMVATVWSDVSLLLQ